MSVQRIIPYHQDGGHGWMAAPVSDLRRLGIEASISSFSYIDGETVYLEEDCDAGRYIDALRAAGDEFLIIEEWDGDRSPIRDLPRVEPV